MYGASSESDLDGLRDPGRAPDESGDLECPNAEISGALLDSDTGAALPLFETLTFWLGSKIENLTFNFLKQFENEKCN